MSTPRPGTLGARMRAAAAAEDLDPGAHLIEDFDGAPYPADVQAAWQKLPDVLADLGFSAGIADPTGGEPIASLKVPGGWLDVHAVLRRDAAG